MPRALPSGPALMRARVGLSPNRPQHDAGIRIEPPPSVACAGFCAASVGSYGAGTAPQGPPVVHSFPSPDRLAGRVALVIDTVLDTGATVEVVRAEALARGASAVRVVCLLDKAARRS